MEGSPCRKFSISWKGVGSRDQAQGSLWWGPGVPIYQGSGDLSPAWRLGERISGYFSPTHMTSGSNYEFKNLRVPNLISGPKEESTGSHIATRLQS
ncbi:hypothetical protein F2Q70_00016809 [Brassica cretica]|uniref:Uncharacterized protein n=1 Tax=Brassica cretica TaxID=69181 RepID=A0A3N6S864_BRACR|nr:hypothetical protein F2Q70_00016809 [Brassica cretica]KAF2599787.1 hypothetical protein F2Q68_00009773 [Brassica cretica]